MATDRRHLASDGSGVPISRQHCVAISTQRHGPVNALRDPRPRPAGSGVPPCSTSRSKTSASTSLSARRTESICGHLTEEMTERYSSVAQAEVQAALGQVVSLAGYRPLLRTAGGRKNRSGGKVVGKPITTPPPPPPHRRKYLLRISFSGAGYRVRTDDIQLGKTKTAVSGRDGQSQVVENTSGGVTWTSSPLRRQGVKSGGKAFASIGRACDSICFDRRRSRFGRVIGADG